MLNLISKTDLLLELKLNLAKNQVCGNKLMQHGCNSEEAVRTDLLPPTAALYVSKHHYRSQMCFILNQAHTEGTQQSLRTAQQYQ